MQYDAAPLYGTGTGVQSPVPVNYPTQAAYSNPYCQVQSVPVPMGQPSTTAPYVDPSVIGNIQNSFVNQMVNAAPVYNGRYYEPPEPPRDYYGWKLQNRIVPRSPEEEDYYLNLYNNSVYPAMISAFRQRIIAQRDAYLRQQSQPGYGSSYQPYYGSTMINPYAANPYMVGNYQQQIIKQQEDYQNRVIAITKRMIKSAFTLRGYSQEEIDRVVALIDPEAIKEREQQRIKREQTIKPIKVKIVRGDETVISGTWDMSDEKVRQLYSNPYAIESDYVRAARLQNAPQIEWKYMNTWADHLRAQDKKYGNMSLVEFLEHGGQLVFEAQERKRKEKERYAITHSFDRNAYSELLKKYEDLNGKYNDGVYQLDESDGFHVDRKKNSITITCPDNFDKYTDENIRKEVEKQTRRRIAFYNMILDKAPESLRPQLAFDFLGQGGPNG